ncbi:hypothetical protein [Novosphingobium sp. BW1]|uniref:hypothetical protein n=1 Tax=Novosphingobium sp. BW1 TaxID=2592621 RepID=UPI0011DE5BCD|nr:hypothetical protein [Novosphingobium sp. BW1]TYC92769.1 hypothetical protein FMM79_01800 [Novosphingobium sp. BW1]
MVYRWMQVLAIGSVSLVAGLGCPALAEPVANEAVPADPALVEGLAGAFRTCQLWILNPDSWASGPEVFHEQVGLGSAMGLVEQVDEINQPPEVWRQGSHYWRINSTQRAGFVVVVSDQLPVCHVTGGGDADFQPVVLKVLESASFKGAWREVDEAARGGMVSTTFVSREEPDFTMVLSRVAAPGARRDRVQVVVSASFTPAGE